MKETGKTLKGKIIDNNAKNGENVPRVHGSGLLTNQGIVQGY